jgi:hypothetical protein
MVSKAKKAGGDGLLLTGEQTNGYGIRQRKHDHDHRDVGLNVIEDFLRGVKTAMLV